MDQTDQARPLRADAERTSQAILEAAERVLSVDPAATMEQIAAAAGVARTTVHRRFTSREALVNAMTAWATQQFHHAVVSARPETTPPLVALYRVTASVLGVKLRWGFAMNAMTPKDPDVARVHAEVLQRCDALFHRMEQSGLLRAGTDFAWARRVYYALIHEAAQDQTAASDEVDELAASVVDTLLHGLGDHAAHTPS